MNDPKTLFYPRKTDVGESTDPEKKPVVTEEKVEQPEETPESAETSTPESAGEKTPEKNEPVKKDVDEAGEKEEAPKSEEETIASYFEKNPADGRKFVPDQYKLKEGDYEEKNGKLIVKADHLADDIKKYFELKGKDAYDHVKRIRKANPEKASLIAKYMGFTFSDGEPDVDGFLSATRRFFSPDTPDDEAKRIMEEQFAEWTYNPEVEAPIVYEKSEPAPKVSPDIPYSLSEISDEIGNLVEIYNEKQDGEGNHITAEQVLHDPAILKWIKSNKYSRENGELLSVKNVVREAFESRYKSQKPAVKTEGGKRGNVAANAPVAQENKRSGKFTRSAGAGAKPSDILMPRKN